VNTGEFREVSSIDRARIWFTNGTWARSFNLRHATPEEIAAAEWEEGKPYKVWIDADWAVRISADEVGSFYVYGYSNGVKEKFNKYEKL
jgi:hypothetical protein